MTDSSPLVHLEIDGVDVSVPPGTNVVDAANTAGIEVPIFCHHPRLEPVGMCRMCLVEVGTPVRDRATGELQLDDDGAPVVRFFPKLQAGCTMQVSEGMIVRTATEEVAGARRSVLEFLLTSHPLDCPVCDKGGECPLQNLTMRYGPGMSRFTWGEKYHFPKPVPVGPLIALDRERCVLCARCIRFEDEIADDQVLGFESRGRGMEIVSVSDPPFDSYFSGNTSDICPVGALTTKDFRFESRVWELEPKPGVCGHCAVGCSLTHDTRSGRIMRVMPRENNAVNEIWLCDKGRFAHHHAAAPDRLTTPLIRRNGTLQPASWDEALGEIAHRLQGVQAKHGSEAIGGLAGDGLCNEDLYLFSRFLRGVLGTNNVDHRPGVVRDDLVARAAPGADLQLTELGAGTMIVVAGLDVEEEAPVLFLNLLKATRRGARVVVLGGLPQKLDAHATALRYAFGGDEAGVATALLAEVAKRVEAADSGSEGLRAALAERGAATLSGRHPVHAADMDAASTAILEADDLLVMFGGEGVRVGLADPLAVLLMLTGRMGRPGSGLIAVGPHANSQGAADMGVLPDWLPGYRPIGDAAAGEALVRAGWPAPPPTAPGKNGADMLSGGVQALYVIGTDPLGDGAVSAEALGALDLLVVHELFPTATTALADVVLPALSLAERDGTLTSLLRRVQRTYAAADPVGEARPDWRILRDLAQRFGVVEAYGDVGDVCDEIARALPSHAGISWAALGPRAATAPTDVFLPFAPITEARHVSYEGTSYRNLVGEGIAWPHPAANNGALPIEGAAVADAATAPSEANGTGNDAPADHAGLGTAANGETSSRDGDADLDSDAVPAAGGAAASSVASSESPESPESGVPLAGAAGFEAAARQVLRQRLLAWRPAAAAQNAQDTVTNPEGSLYVVIARRLYDAGTLARRSPILRPLVPVPTFWLSPFDLGPRGLVEGMRVAARPVAGSATDDTPDGGKALEGLVGVREGLTPGTVVVEESLAWNTAPAGLLRGGRSARVVLEPVSAEPQGSAQTRTDTEPALAASAASAPSAPTDSSPDAAQE